MGKSVICSQNEPARKLVMQLKYTANNAQKIQGNAEMKLHDIKIKEAAEIILGKYQEIWERGKLSANIIVEKHTSVSMRKRQVLRIEECRIAL